MTTKTKKKPTVDRIAVVSTSSGDPLILRSNPDEEAVRGFVAEVKRRHFAGEVGGPSGLPALLPISAAYFVTEDAFRNDMTAPGDPIDLTGILETP